MIKSKSPVLLIGIIVILFTIGFTPYLTQEAFAAAPTISSYVADDPDDLDVVYSNDDTLTINLSAASNATTTTCGGSTFPCEISSGAVTGNFTFSPNPISGATFTAEWTSNSALRLTFSSIGTAVALSTSNVVVNTGNTIGPFNNGSDNTVMIVPGSTVSLTGDFGLFVAATVTNNGGGCSGDCVEPTLGIDRNGKRVVDNGFTYNGKSIDVERYFTPYPLVTVQTGKQNVAEFKIYEDSGLDKISHLELAFGLAKGESVGMSKAVINWDRTFDGIETVTLDDPENVLDKIKVTTSEGYCSEESQTKCLIVKVTHTFRAPLDFDILGTNVWDIKRNAWQNYYNHGIEVIGESLNPPKEYDGINKGHIYHLTETSKTTAVDEFGNSWSFNYGLWNMDYVMQEKIQDTSSIMTREHSEFPKYKETQANKSIEQLLVQCPTCLTSFADFKDSSSLIYSERIDRANNLELQQNMILEETRAQETLKYILNPSLHLK
ncbi:MAG: hypothetical protein ACW9W4_04330 [Candidatus Nitrosopumilus sp. bin_7KS]